MIGFLHLHSRWYEHERMNIASGKSVFSAHVRKTDVDTSGGSIAGGVGSEPVDKDLNPQVRFTAIGMFGQELWRRR